MKAVKIIGINASPRKLVQTIRREISYPDQDAVHTQRREMFCQMIKFNKDRFAHNLRLV